MTPKQLISEIDKLSPKERQRIVLFAESVDCFGSVEAAASWWLTGNPHLRGRKPYSCAVARVIKLLQRIDHNL